MKHFFKKIIFLSLITITLSPNITQAVTCRLSYDDDAYCREHGYSLVGDTGCEAGTCIFPNGSSCLSTDFYNGTCGKEFRKELACAQNGKYAPSYTECCSGKKISHFGPGGFASWVTCENNAIYYSTKLLRAWPELVIFTLPLFVISLVIYVKRKK